MAAIPDAFLLARPPCLRQHAGREGGIVCDARKTMKIPAKISNGLIRWLGMVGCIFASFWIAGQWGPRDGWYYVVTAMVLCLALWAVYCVLVYSLTFAWSRWGRSLN